MSFLQTRAVVLNVIDYGESDKIVTFFTEQFGKINSTWTDHFMKLLDRYGAILEKIQNRANIEEGNGKDITAVNAAIQLAKTAIMSAQEAITQQAANSYEIDESEIATTDDKATESGQNELVQRFRIAFQNIHNLMFGDLHSLGNGPIASVRKAVQDAFQALNQISNQN